MIVAIAPLGSGDVFRDRLLSAVACSNRIDGSVKEKSDVESQISSKFSVCIAGGDG